MSYDTNPANDDATGDSDQPSRAEVERAIERFNDVDEFDAYLTQMRRGEWLIQVQDGGDIIETFESLDEFDEFVSDRSYNRVAA